MPTEHLRYGFAYNVRAVTVLEMTLMLLDLGTMAVVSVITRCCDYNLVLLVDSSFLAVRGNMH